MNPKDKKNKTVLAKIALEKRKRSLPLDRVLVIINIVTTIFSTIVLTIYFKSRDENLARELLKAQQDFQLARAELTIDSKCPPLTACQQSFNITNHSEFDAKNIKLAIYPTMIDQSWQKDIVDMSYFDFKTNIDIDGMTSSLFTTKAFNSMELNGNNALKIQISRIPPQGQISIRLYPNEQKIKIKQDPITISALLKNLRYEDTMDIGILEDQIRKYLQNKAVIAKFTLDIECDNCKSPKTSPEFNISYLKFANLLPKQTLRNGSSNDVFVNLNVVYQIQQNNINPPIMANSPITLIHHHENKVVDPYFSDN